MRDLGHGLRNEKRVLQHFAQMLVLIVIVAGADENCRLYAQDAAESKPAAAEQEAETENVRPTIDLGMFHVKDLRPARNETDKVSFRIHLALQQSVSPSTVAQLEHWQHRLRNEVLIAIRLTEKTDFLEPNLHKFRRRISLRVNRALKAILVSEALLTEFTFTTN